MAYDKVLTDNFIVSLSSPGRCFRTDGRLRNHPSSNVSTLRNLARQSGRRWSFHAIEVVFVQLHQILETKAPDEAQSGSVWRRGGPAPQPAPARGDVEGFEILKGGPAQKRPPLVVVEGGALGAAARGSATMHMSSP
eukprot:3944957-Pyramimonas_sp.AAC.1